jgi:hypothetical protein
MRNFNSDTYTATPSALHSPYSALRWASNNFDVLTAFAFPTDNQLKYTFATANPQSRVTFSQILHCKTRDRKTSFRMEEVLQFSMQLEEAFLWAKCTTEEIKVQLTHKNLVRCPLAQQDRWRFYSSYSVTREISNLSFKLGALWSNPLTNNFLDTRLRLNSGEFTNEQYLYCKGAYTFNGVWNLGGIFAVDLKRRVLQKNDLKLGWEVNDSNWLSLQLETEGFRNYRINYLRLGSYFDILRGNYICRFGRDKLLAGLSVTIHRLRSSTTSRTSSSRSTRRWWSTTSWAEVLRS